MTTLPLVLLCLVADESPGPLQPLGRLNHPPIREASGIVASRCHPGVFWVHNDSGNPPALFAVRRDGTLIREYAVNVLNIDWEDIATDDEGHLYLGDIGNNGGHLPLRSIYCLDEPDPARPDQGKLVVSRAWYYRFPPKGRFDAESLFIDRGRAMIVAKTFDKREAELFMIPLEPRERLVRPAMPERVGVLPSFTEPATGADLRADGFFLAVCSLHTTRVYRRDSRDSDDWLLIGTVRYEADGIEAIAWDGEDLILAGEGRGLYRIAAATWRAPRPSPARAER